MRRSLFLIPLALGLSGCISYCKSEPLVTRAAAGDLEAMAEVGELGRPRIPSSAEPLVSISSAFEALAPHLKDRDEPHRLLAIEGLRKLSERAPDVYRNHFPAVLQPALADESPEVRARAAWAFGRLGESNDALRALALDPVDEVAEAACEALGRARDDKALELLARALDRAGPVATAATHALARLSGQELKDADAWKSWVARRLATRASIAPIASPDTAVVQS